MWRECIAGRFGRFDPARSLLLMKEDRVCGDVMAAQTGLQDAFIANLAIDPAHRGGTGRALLLTCLWSYKDAGFRQVGLAVTFDNRRAFRLYESLGFRVTGRFPILSRAPRPARATR
jgi:ribosomal protein S18 acetylase RimI-like enzyme